MAALSSSANGMSKLIETAADNQAVQIMSNFGGFGCQVRLMATLTLRVISR